MEEEKVTSKPETIECPKDPDKRYFKKYCETVFRTSTIRPWCRECPHFTATTGTDNRKSEPVPETKNHDP